MLYVLNPPTQHTAQFARDWSLRLQRQGAEDLRQELATRSKRRKPWTKPAWLTEKPVSPGKPLGLLPDTESAGTPPGTPGERESLGTWGHTGDYSHRPGHGLLLARWSCRDRTTFMMQAAGRFLSESPRPCWRAPAASLPASPSVTVLSLALPTLTPSTRGSFCSPLGPDLSRIHVASSHPPRPLWPLPPTLLALHPPFHAPFISSWLFSTTSALCAYVTQNRGHCHCW